jgi:integrase
MQCVNKKCMAELAEGSVFCHICGKRQQQEPKKHVKRANGSGTVYKLSGRRRRPWVAAKAGVVIGYYEKKGDAQEAINALASKPMTERYNMTFKEVYEAWKKEHFRDLKSDKGIEGYETAYSHFATLHDTRFREIRSEHYQAEIDKLIEKGRAHSTTNKLKQLAGQLSKWAMREEIITTNYAQFIKLQENVKTEKEIFTEKEIYKLWESNDDAAKIVLMLIYTGMRIGELFTLEVKNVHEKYCIGGVKTEAGKDRIIPIPPEVRHYFKYFKSMSDKLLIDGYGGNQSIRNFRNRDYYGLLEFLEIEKKTPHSTRHTFASMARASGMKPEVLQKILGHAKYSTTADIYVHADLDLLINAAEKLTQKKKQKK